MNTGHLSRIANDPKVSILEKNFTDQKWVEDTLKFSWGGVEIASLGRLVNASHLPALIAWQGGERVGLLTYQVTDKNCEITSLDSLIKGKGIGSDLLKSLVSKARFLELECIWLITSNDNLEALRFYQRRDFSLVRIHRDAITRARLLKPSIPEIGENQIPIRDEIELEYRIY